MEKLELKHIAPYLPYGVKAEILDYKSDYVGNQFDEIIGVHQWDKNCMYWSALTIGGSKPNIERIKPILRPLSDLSKEIEHNGEKFVPIIYLSRLVDNGHNHIDSKIHKSSNYITVMTDKCDDVENVKFRFIIEGFSSIERSGEPISLVTYDKIKSKLFEWHFDVFGLIEKGLAVDIHTISDN